MFWVWKTLRTGEKAVTDSLAFICVTAGLGDDGDLGLPLQWLWDMIDEFLFQFQSYSQNRCKLSNKTTHELNLLKENPDVWSVTSVSILSFRGSDKTVSLQRNSYNCPPGCRWSRIWTRW